MLEWDVDGLPRKRAGSERSRLTSGSLSNEWRGVEMVRPPRCPSRHQTILTTMMTSPFGRAAPALPVFRVRVRG
jgi:hypothetical protein